MVHLFSFFQRAKKRKKKVNRAKNLAKKTRLMSSDSKAIARSKSLVCSF